MTPPIMVTEDTPPDMLAGSMDLNVVLPGGHSLKMSIQRSMPMMDLLVHVTTANKMSPAGYIIKPLNERGPLPYKPSTPIGALDAWTIHVVPKQLAQCASSKKPLKILNQPFEQTFRLQVHLPRNQLYVARVSPKTKLVDIIHQVCSEKNLDPLKYSLRHPSNLDQVLNLNCCLGDYKLQEVTLVCNRSHPVEVSTVDIMSLQRESSNPAYRNVCEGSISSGSLEGRSLSPIPSDESSASPPPLPPSRPVRKRRPAPKPPKIIELKVTKEENQALTMIHHSRNSSDSSGYHEASVLSESPNLNSVPGPKIETTLSPMLSQSMTDVRTTSFNSLSSKPGLKKKSAPPPPPTLIDKNKESSDQQRTPSISSTASSTTTLDGNEMNATVKSATLPPSSRLNRVSSPPPSPLPPKNVDVEPTSNPPVAPVPRPRCDSDIVVSFKPQPKPRKTIPQSPVKSGRSANLTEEKSKQTINMTIDEDSVFQLYLTNNEKLCSTKDENQIQHNLPERQMSCIENDTCNDDNLDLCKLENKQIEEDCVQKLSDKKSKNDTPSSALEDPESTTAVVVGSNAGLDGDMKLVDEEIDRIFANATRNHSSPEPSIEVIHLTSLPSPPTSLVQSECLPSSRVDALDWEYKLPAPPRFRDEAEGLLGTVPVENINSFGSSDVKQESPNKTDLQKIIEWKGRIIENNESSSILKTNSCDSEDCSSTGKTERRNSKGLSNNRSSAEDCTDIKSTDSENSYGMEQNVIVELTSTLSQRPSKVELNSDTEIKETVHKLSSRNILDNFTITTYKDKKPLEVFEDDSIKSSVGEKRDKSKDDAVFRAPKPRVKEPNLSRRSSFNIENHLNGPVIKRSVSYVSLLAANMPRNSQPYKVLQRQSCDGQYLWQNLRKTTSELNIDIEGRQTRDNSLWQDSADELQSVQVLRNILSQSQANLPLSTKEPDNTIKIQESDPHTSHQKFEDVSENYRWGQSHSEEINFECLPKQRFEHSSSVDEENPKSVLRSPPSVDVTSWSERPKRQISIKNDCDYISGFGKKSTVLDEMVRDRITHKDFFPYSKFSNFVDGPIQSDSSLKLKSIKVDGRSKSINDLSRIPVVKSVELKKPSSSNIFIRPVLKPIKILDNSNNNPTNSKSNHIQSTSSDDNDFVSVDTLARRFGVPHKRPMSEYISVKNINLQSDVKDTSKSINNNSYLSVGNTTVVSKTNGKLERNDLKTDTGLQAIKTDSTTLEVKAQAKLSSGGSVFDGSEVTSFRRDNSAPLLRKPRTFSDSVANESKILQNHPKSCATLDRNVRLSNLQPVVKGFRMVTQSNPGLCRNELPVAKDINIQTNSSSSSLHRTYDRTLSSPNISSVSSTNIKESTKEKSSDVCSVTPATNHKSKEKIQTVSEIPPPPPLLPVLKPVGERRGIKTVPPPSADPRDMLLQSIRSFGKENLKKVSSSSSVSNKLSQ